MGSGLIEEALPATLAEAHAMIRELREQFQPLQAELISSVANVLHLTNAQAALVVVLARARRPITAGQIEARLPTWTGVEIRDVGLVKAHAYAVRRQIGPWAIRTERPAGYVLDEELAIKVRRIA